MNGDQLLYALYTGSFSFYIFSDIGVMDYNWMKVGRVENLDRLSLLSLTLKRRTLVAVTASAGREFHG